MKKSIGARTIIYPAPVLVVGTYDKTGKPNAMTAAWGGICCSSPPCVAVSLRKATYTYGNILAHCGFTINIPSEAYIHLVDYFGMVSGKKIDKFAVSGLTPVRSTLVNAPYIEEFPVVLECRLHQHIEIGLHTQFIGEILDVKADEAIMDTKGLPDIEKLKPFFYVPEANIYYGAGKYLGKAFSIGKDIEKK